MKSFKERWEIQKNWQLIFPFLGFIALAYTAYFLTKTVARYFIERQEQKIIYYTIVAIGIVVLYYLLLRFFLWCFKKLSGKWVTEYRWEMIAIFLVFALTGSSSVRIAKPILEYIGFTRTVFPDGFLYGFLYWMIRIIIILPLYQLLLIIYGTIFGQFKFFWEFEKKMLRRMRIIK